MRSAPILQRLASSRRSDAMALTNCSGSSPIRVTTPTRDCVHIVSLHSAPQLRMLKAEILEFDRMISAWHRSNETSKRLDAIPGVGSALATALVAGVADPKTYPIRTTLPSLGWAGAKATLERRQGKARQH
jgi:transposase